MSKNKLF